MRDKVYRGAETNEISFPLGGIGTGCIGLAGNGRLIDWEIQNRPNKGSVNGFSHLAIRAERAGKVLDARVLNGDLPAPYSGSFTGGKYASFGFGPPREALAGVPHFREAVFHGLYPLARVEFADPTFPGQVTLDAYNPYIPLNDRDSSIPAAFLEVGVQNPTDEPLSYAVCLAVLNPLRAGVPFNRYEERDALKFMHLSAQGLAADDPTAGGVVIATDAERVSYQESWFRGAWFDNLTIYWRDLNTPGPFRNRTYAADPADRQAARGDHGLLAAHIDVAPGETRRVRYVISWSFPNRVNDWNPRACECATAGCAPAAEWRNHYATLFADARDSAAYALCEWDRLYAETERFQQTLCSSTVPDEVIDAVTANLSVLKSPTCLRLEDGTFYGFEGCHVCEGCCEGSCTHVWNYAQALPYLYPALERSMRDADFVHNMGEDGGMGFRLQLPLGRERSSFRPCVDGQFGGIIKAYRDWKISGDTDWLRRHWTAMKKMISYAWAETNPDGWDRDRDGVLEGRQHHTLDMELFGPSAWLTGFYLAALKAGAEIAEALGEPEIAADYRALFERGRAWVDSELFNGEYYQQRIDLHDKGVLERYAQGASMVGDALAAYWDAEHGEIKYQVGDGCGIDQLLAQWHANGCGLGDIFDLKQRRIALRALFEHLYKEPMRDSFNACRVFSLNDEAGLLICAWPAGRQQAAVPLPYAQETMTGFEYAAACLLIQEGLVEEGLRVVRAVRARFDGRKRNPWNEFECGSNYARSMASYGLLQALCGLEYNLVDGTLGFDPVPTADGRFVCFWSLGSGWGTLMHAPQEARVAVLAGELRLRRLHLPSIAERRVQAVCLGDTQVPFAQQGDWLTFGPVIVVDGQPLQVRWV